MALSEGESRSGKAGGAPDRGRVLVVTFYRFVSLPDRVELAARWRKVAGDAGVFGTILLAEEGVNGTLAGSAGGVRAVLAELRRDPRLADLAARDSWAEEPPFYRLRIRLKSEIVSMGQPDVDPRSRVGTYVGPREWDALLDRPDVVVVDVRNRYETAIGGFDGAIDPETDSFREFPEWLEQRTELASRPPVAMYCTGGIRCEKATALLRERGFEEVYHLQGGILRYLEESDSGSSRWRGECFVFDQRVALDSELEPGSHDLCHACRWPVDAAARESEHWVPGVSCPRCHDRWTGEQRGRFAERQRQMEIAEELEIRHLGRVFEHQPAGESQPPRGRERTRS